MRVHFSSLTLPKKAAKRFQEYYSHSFMGRKEVMPLSIAQERTAFLLGYDNWHELDKVTKTGLCQPSKTDEQLTSQELDERIKYQLNRMGHLSPVCGATALKTIYELQVSSSTGKNTGYHDYSHNRIHETPRGHGDYEINLPNLSDKYYLYRSTRSMEKMDEIDDMHDSLESDGESVAYLRSVLTEMPEALNAIWYLASKINHDVKTSPLELNNMFSQVVDIIPKTITGNDHGWMNWYEIDCRDYIRALLCLGYAFCTTGKTWKDESLTKRGFALLWAYGMTDKTEQFDFISDLADRRLKSKYDTWVKKQDTSRPLIDLLRDAGT